MARAREDKRLRRESRGGVAVLVVAALALCSPGTAEPAEHDLRFGHLGAEQGLSSNWVLAVLRDSRGFLWVGTQDGLNRYDGHTFVTYTASGDDPHSLPSPTAGVLYEDSRGHVWIGSRWAAEGMARYDRVLDRFERIPYGRGSGGLQDGRVNAIVGDDEGRLWVGTRAGVEKIGPDGASFETFVFGGLEPGRDPPRMVVSLLRARSGVVWAGTTEGLFVLDDARGECVPWQAPEMPAAAALRRARIETLLEDHAGTIWVGTITDGLFEIAPAGPTIRRHLPDLDEPASLSHARVRSLVQDGQGRLWIGTENGGLNVLDLETRAFRRYAPDPLAAHGLGSASVYALHADRQGILWIGTYNNGLNYVAPSEQRFALVTPSHDGLRDSHVSAFLEDREGNLWVGTDGGGVARFEAVTGRVSILRHDPRDPTSIGSDSVLTLVEEEDGMIWLGGWGGGLSRIDPATRRARRFRHDPRTPTSLVGDDVWRLRRLPSGKLLVATQQGVDLLDPDAGTFVRLADLVPGVESSMTLALEVTPKGGYWIGQSGRVQHVDGETGTVTTYAYSSTGPSRLPAGMVFSILEDSAGNTWFGTERGLFHLPASRPLGGDLETIAGLPHATVTNVLEDWSGNIWVTTHRGLSRLAGAVRRPTAATPAHFDISDGLQGSEFTRGAALRGRDGRLYVGGPKGYNVFRPESIRLNAAPPPVVLTDLRIFNRSVAPDVPGSPLERAAPEARTVTLTQDQFVVSFEFAALNLDLPQKNRYAYMLEGLERDWNVVDGRREATYTQLRPGSYVLRVRASNNDGVWNDDGLAVRVRVLPRWFERWWARSFFVALAGLLALAAYRWRVRHLHAREADLAQRVDDRTRALNQLNEELEQRVAARTQELEQEKERLAVTLRSIGDGVVATDVESRVVLLNRVAEQLSGWSAEDARGRPLRDVLPLVDAATRAPLRDPVSAVLRGESAWAAPWQCLLVRTDGVERVLAQSVAPIRDQHSRTVGVVLVMRDVTDQRKVEEQLQNSQKLEALGILAGGIAHDFNNLLTGIFGYLDVTRHRWADRPQEVDALGKALAVLDRARGLTGQLLTFSRGGEPLTAPLDLGDLLRRSADFALSGSNVVCELRVADDLWACEGDRRQIDQVVDNILLNARQAMPEGGTIEVVADNVSVGPDDESPVGPGRYVRVTVCDEGPGIPLEARSRIFEPFFSTKAQGTGLGLATSYSIVRKHGGHVGVVSEARRGACFVIYLPASDRPAARSRDAPHATRERRCRVLVMDDEDYVRDVVGEMLGELGHTAEAVADGDGAVAAYRRAAEAGCPFDIVMLDLTIPGGPGGLVVLTRIKSLDSNARVVASSGYSGDPVMADPLRHGFAARLTKPYTMADLDDVIARVMEKDTDESPP